MLGESIHKVSHQFFHTFRITLHNLLHNTLALEKTFCKIGVLKTSKRNEMLLKIHAKFLFKIFLKEFISSAIYALTLQVNSKWEFIFHKCFTKRVLKCFPSKQCRKCGEKISMVQVHIYDHICPRNCQNSVKKISCCLVVNSFSSYVPEAIF